MGILRRKLFVFISLVLIAFFIFACLVMKKSINASKKTACKSNLQKLTIGLKKQINAEESIGHFWCDVVTDKKSMDKKYFICPGSNTKDRNYAMNKHIIDSETISLDIVVLFDSKSGWNLVGGQEMLAPENHNGKGCNILFGDMTVKFITVENFDKLRWKP